jgi:hypothetical protein
MKINNYTPKTNDRELLDFVNDVTAIINGGRIGVDIISTTPSISGASAGELRLYVDGTDVRLFALSDNAWYSFQYRPITQSGWGYVLITAAGAAAGYQIASVTFPVTFATAPYIMASYIGTKATAPTLITSITGANTLRSVAAYATSTTGFSIVIQNSAGGLMTAGQYECFAWYAIST